MDQVHLLLSGEIFWHMDKWEAEFDGNCMALSTSRGQLEGINVMVGNQIDISTLDKWIEQSGGAIFDVVIDDGGHQ